jgi:short-subunit dehydrogenase
MANQPYGTTVITGASSGIGAAFAREFAQRGSEVVLVARRRERLEALAAEITHDTGARATVVEQDLAQPDAGRALKAELDRLGISASSVVNNAGFGVHGPLALADPAALSAMIRLNVEALVDVTRSLLPDLIDAGRGALINVASNAGYQPVPGMATYAATKAFVLSFTEALWHELKGTGVRVLAISPGPTRTEFFDVVGSMESPGTLQAPEQVVSTAMAALARRNPPPSVVSGWATALQSTAVRWLPRRTAIAIASGFTAAKVPISR